jgi:hypothetical protein
VVLLVEVSVSILYYLSGEVFGLRIILYKLAALTIIKCLTAFYAAATLPFIRGCLF